MSQSPLVSPSKAKNQQNELDIDFTTRFNKLSLKNDENQKPKINAERLESLKTAGFYEKRQVLDDKIKQFEHNVQNGNIHYQNALDEGEDFQLALLKAEYDFLYSNKDDETCVDDFKIACQNAIIPARFELEKHRGWTQFFLEFASLIVSLVTVVPFVIGCAHAASTGNTSLIFGLFPAKTDSATKLDDFEDCLKEITKPTYIDL